MTTTPPSTAAIATVTPRRRSVLATLLRRPVAVTVMALLALIVLASALAGLITPISPTAVDLQQVLAPPSAEHLLGGDSSGRDNFARLLYGGQASLISAIIAITTGLIVGVPAGLIAGFRSGLVDGVLLWVSNLLMSIPAVIALLAVVAGFGSSNTTTMIAFGILLAPSAFQLTRSAVRAVREELYIDAARVAGLGTLRILALHVLRVVRPPLVIWATLTVGLVIITQAGLQYLGVGDTSSASWGAMVNDAQRNIFSAGWQIYPPGIAIGLTALCFGILDSEIGDVLAGDTGKGSRAMRRLIATYRKVNRTARGGAAGKVDQDTQLHIEGLRVSYPKPDGSSVEVVHGINLTVRAGEILGVVGESGSGKSQTAFSILGLLPEEAMVSASTLHVAGHDLGRLPVRRRARALGGSVGYVPQDPMTNLDPTATVGAQLVAPLRQHLGLSKTAATARALKLLERVGVNDPKKTFGDYPHQLSGGLAQRVLIAGAVSCNPTLIVADEATTALDVSVQADVLDLLRDLQAELGTAMVLVTHDLGVVADLCTTVAVMRHGEIVETGTTLDVFRTPQHPYTRELLDSVLDDAETRTLPSTTLTEA